MSKNRLILLSFLISLLCLPSARAHRTDDMLFQTSTIDALLEGVYDGHMTLSEMRGYGDFGIGTFNELDGEMIVLDGTVYQIKSDGKVYEPAGSMKTPFASVHFFAEDDTLEVDPLISYEELQTYIDSRLKTPNLPVAVKITGIFAAVEARSVPKQSKPYPKLAEVVKEQSIFQFADIRGTMVGYRLPAFVKGINVPGYHLHFLTRDGKAGGHVLKLITGYVEVKLDYLPKFMMALAEEGAFLQADLTKDKSAALSKVEK